MRRKGAGVEALPRKRDREREGGRGEVATWYVSILLRWSGSEKAYCSGRLDASPLCSFIPSSDGVPLPLFWPSAAPLSRRVGALGCLASCGFVLPSALGSEAAAIREQQLLPCVIVKWRRPLNPAAALAAAPHPAGTGRRRTGVDVVERQQGRGTASAVDLRKGAGATTHAGTERRGAIRVVAAGGGARVIAARGPQV